MKKQTAVEWLIEQIFQHNNLVKGDGWFYVKPDIIEQAKAMEATSKQMSYGDGYSNGYDRALELVKWKINNELSINNK